MKNINWVKWLPFKVETGLEWICISLIFLLGMTIQAHSFLNWDVRFLMQASERLLSGGNYLADFFETNPPMILYLYSLPVIVAKKVGLSFILSLRVFVALLALISLTLCYLFFKKIFSANRLLVSINMIALTVIYLLLPAYEFGQREHLFMMLVTPYILAAILLLTKQPINQTLAFIVGFLAGVGFAIKPFFLLPFILIELTLIFYHRNAFAWLRIDSLLVVAILMSYLLSVLIVAPDYLFIIVPLLSRLYYAGFSRPITWLLQGGIGYFFAAPFAFYFLQIRRSAYKSVLSVVLIGSVGMIGIYLAEGTFWYYHMLPAMGFTLLFLTALASTWCAGKTVGAPFRYISGIFNKPTLSHLATCIVFIGYSFAFCFAFEIVFYCNKASLENRFDERAELIRFLAVTKPPSIYFLSTNGYSFPIVDYLKLTPLSRFPNYWWLPGLLNLSEVTQDKTQFNQLEKDKAFLIDLVVQDIAKKPAIILLDARPFNIELRRFNFNYIRYFSQNEKFKRLWQRYHFVKKVGDFEVYALN